MLAKRVGQGELYPRGYGFAYHRYDLHYGICYPLGLNVLVRLVRKFWIWIMSGSAIGHDRILEAYLKGRQDGFEVAAKSLEKSSINQ